MAARVCTLGMYRTLLVHELSRYDRHEFARESKRGRGNIHRLAIILGAIHEEMDPVIKGKEGSTAPEDRAAFRSAIGRAFLEDFRPVVATLKQMDAGTCRLRK